MVCISLQKSVSVGTKSFKACSQIIEAVPSKKKMKRERSSIDFVANVHTVLTYFRQIAQFLAEPSTPIPSSGIVEVAGVREFLGDVTTAENTSNM